jgi:hypothetical protein
VIIIIDEVKKDYLSDLEFVKYLGMSLGLKRIGKVKFAEDKIQKMLNEIDKLKFKELANKQMLKVIRIMILTQLNYIFSNGFIFKRQTEIIDKRIRKLIYNFIKDKTISKAYIYTPLNFGGLGVAEIKMEMHVYNRYHVVRLFLIKEGQRIMKNILTYRVKRSLNFYHYRSLLITA